MVGQGVIAGQLLVKYFFIVQNGPIATPVQMSYSTSET